MNPLSHFIVALQKQVSFDFLRGILFAAILRDAVFFLPINYPLSSVLGLGFRIIVIIASVLYALILIGLLFRPATTLGVISWLLLSIAVACLIPLAWGDPPFDSNTCFLALCPFVSGPRLTAVIAFVTLAKLRHDQKKKYS